MHPAIKKAGLHRRMHTFDPCQELFFQRIYIYIYIYIYIFSLKKKFPTRIGPMHPAMKAGLHRRMHTFDPCQELFLKEKIYIFLFYYVLVRVGFKQTS